MNRIRELRKEKGITQVRLSIELEVSQENVSAYEKGKYYPSAECLIKLRNFFDVNIDYILGLTDFRHANVHADGLTSEEHRILAAYRNFDPIQKARLRGYADALLSEIPD